LQVPREPDGVTWMGNDYFATADEGDFIGGSRGFTIFTAQGDIVYTSGNMLEHLNVRVGHYPEYRSGNKGAEPENCFYGVFGGEKLLFINMERANTVAVFNVDDPANPVYQQILATAVGPEGGIAIPGRNAFVVASEVDSRGDGIRSSLNIYQRDAQTAAYPSLVSLNREGLSVPIPWSAMSGLGAGAGNTLYAIEDSYYNKNRIFTIDTSSQPAVLTKETRIMDTGGVFAAFTPQGGFDADDLAAMINDDMSVNIDGEGVAMFTLDGNDVWVVASEGAGNSGDTSRPVEKLNFLFFVGMDGVIVKVATLPEALNLNQLRYGFEGVAPWGEKLVVAFQRAWPGGDAGARLGIYSPADDSWEFVFYPLDTVESQNGGWVGLSDISPLGNGAFAVLERDNASGPDAAIKRVYTIDLSSMTDGGNITKVLHTDLMPLLQSTGGLVAEKVEGLAVVNGMAFIMNDNDGVDDNSGETNLFKFAWN